MNQSLTAILRNLPAAGPSGFEGLIAELLNHFTGQQFYLAQSGTQQGRDMSSRHPHANVIAVECKRYGSKTELDQRELLGEIVQATTAIPDLDLWVLVASRDVSSQLREALQRATLEHGVELLIISDADASPSSLAVVCADSPAIVVAFMQQHLPDAVPHVQALLTQIAATPDYAARRAYLRENLITPLLGYDNWRTEQNRWLTQSFQSAAASHAHFGQILNIGQEGIRLIERRAAWQGLDTWFNAWKDNRRPYVVLGQEGDGKTWAVASWVRHTVVRDPHSLPVIFLSSAALQTNEPLEILVQAVAHHSTGMNIEQVRKRVKRWLQRSTADTPLFLVVLDGINERYDIAWWRGLLEQLNIEPWSQSLAVVITCRTGYWDNFALLRSIKTISHSLQLYDDHELDAALAAHHLQRADIHANLLDLARKPRYFDLLVRYRERLAESGDVTFDRLIYEDWRDRLQRKRNLALSDSDFQNLLRDLAAKYLDGEKTVHKRQLIDALPFATEQMVEELRTSGVFHERNGIFQVQQPHLIFGFALLLVEQVEEATRDGNNVMETIAGWLEPHAAMDIKAHICEAAALRALEMPDLPTSAKVALLHTWLTSQNNGQQAETNVSAYFPVDPISYFELAEAIWSDAFDHAWGQQLLMRTFLRWIMHEQQAALPLWSERFERWLGFVHRFYYPYLGERTEEEARKIQHAMTERLGTALEPGSFTFAGYQLTAIDDDGLMRLGRVALALISYVPREPYIHVLAASCVAEAIMDQPNRYDALAWIIRTSQRPLWHVVQPEVEQLFSANSRIAQQAAYRLLSFVGNEAAQQTQKALPTDLFPPHPLARQHANDPCVSGFLWSRQDCERCVARTDIAPNVLARELKSYCIDPDFPAPEGIGARLAPLAETIDIQSMHSMLAHTSADHAFDSYEAALCAYAPEALADVVRRLVGHIAERQGMALRQLSLFPRHHSLILTQTEYRAIYQAWAKLHEAKNFTDDTAKTAEMFLFPEVLQQLDAQEQLAHILNRPEELPDRVVFGEYFQPISIWEPVWQKLATAATVKATTRILWFLSAHATTIAQQDIDTHIVPLLLHEESFVRAMALLVIVASKAENALTRIIHGSWTWQASAHDEENHWGSYILCEHDTQLPFPDVARRVHPVYLGYAVRCRGNKSDEVAIYAEMIHHQWLWLGSEAPALPADFPAIYLETLSTGDDIAPIHRRGLAERTTTQSLTYYATDAAWGGDVETETPDFQEAMGQDFAEYQQESFARVKEAVLQQAAAGNTWFAHRFSGDAFDQVLHIRPDLVDQWVSNAFSEQPDAVRRLQIGSTFYEALCEALLQVDPERGLALYWHLQTVPMYVFTRDSNSEIPLLDYALFKAPSIDSVQHAWQQRLEQCTTDQELLKVVIAAQSGQAKEWLWSYIVQALQTDVPLTSMRAITLLGLIDSEAGREQLSELLLQVPDTWLRTLVNTSRERWQRNAWAKHWFHRFLTVDDDSHAWAAFHLFLRCTDRRFWLWRSQILDTVGRNTLPSNRRSFLKHNQEEIEYRAKKNEDTLEEQFLGQKIKDGQLWPWM